MSQLNSIPTGPEVQSHWLSARPAALPEIPPAWSASILATPFGDSITPQSQQLVVAKVESATVGFESWMRVRLYLSQDLRFFDFLFISVNNADQPFTSEWYWIDSSVGGRVNEIHGPLKTTLRVPGPRFLHDNQAVWGNQYPLMCTDTQPDGIDCDHWMIPTPGAQPDHGSWYSVRRDTGQFFRVCTMDSSNPMMLPFIGAFYVANFASFEAAVSETSRELVAAIRARRKTGASEYLNPMITQQDILRALAVPLASAECTMEDIQDVLPGFTTEPLPRPRLPEWNKKLYIEAWALAVDLIPYRMRVCYRFTGDDQSKQQSIFIGWGPTPGAGSYFRRTDTCLNAAGTDMPYYEWNDATEWGDPKYCLPSIPGVGAPFPDWPARNNAVIMAQIRGNPDFGLEDDQVLNIIAGQNPGKFGKLGTFWAWFLGNNVGMLFCESDFINSLSHTLQVLDYTLFQQNAPVAAGDFVDPCAGLPPPAAGPVASVARHLAHPHPTGNA